MKKTRGFEICKGYEDKDIKLPIRKTKNSAGYDFEAAEDTVIPSFWKSVFANIKNVFKAENVSEDYKPTLVKTGIKAYCGKDEVLILANRSSNPMKKGLILANSIGVIDSDYYGNKDNDGNIMYAFYNFFPFDTVIKKHEVIGQAYFQNFLIADNDAELNANATREGGFGSTDAK
ncbi:MAG: dUTP diphosphatase [Clostridia bacterium]|nr:dUTP diphosphatase [Clostridia bacterium]